MLNALSNAKFDVNDVLSMLEGHHKFIQKNTGKTDDGEVQHYLVNPEGIFSNNRHFIQKGGQMGMPNGDAPTESQSLCILGYCYAYMATQKKEYLDAAKHYFDAYVEFYYSGQPIPDVPSITHPWVSNWLVNGKEPVLANYPLSDDGTITHGGWRDKAFEFKPTGANGELQCRIPQDTTDWGQYLDRATFAYEGGLGWKSIVATVYGLKPDGVTIDWSDSGKKRGKQYDVDWIIDHYGRKISYDDGFVDYTLDSSGEKIATIHPDSEKGLVQLKKTYRNLQTDKDEVIPAGTYKLCYATRNPLNKDVAGANGFELPRNKPWHNRPLNVPAGYNATTGQWDDYQQLGNSSDSEQWFADAAYLLYKITNDDKYRKAWQAVIFNTYAYSDIDAHDKFFRVDRTSDNPWTDGIAYDYNYFSDADYPNGLPDPVLTRDKTTGYIGASCVAGMQQHTMEQQAVWYKVNGDSVISTEAGGSTADGRSVALTVDVKLTNSKQESTDNADKYTYSVEPSAGGAYPHDIPLKKFTRSVRDDGKPYLLVGNHVSVWSNNDILNRCTLTSGWSANILESGRDGGYKNIKWPFKMDPSYVTGASLGLTWSWDDNPDGTRPTVPINSIVYRSTVPFEVGYYDSKGWSWTFTVPATGTSKNIDDHAWGTYTFDIHLAKLNANQKNHPHPPWFREIRNASDVGGHGWYIPSDQPAQRMYYNGVKSGATYVHDAAGNIVRRATPADREWLWDLVDRNVIQGTKPVLDKNGWPVFGNWGFDPNYYNLDKPEQFVIKDYYGNVYLDFTPPSLPSSGIIDEQFDVTFVGSPDSSPTSDGSTQIYCVNELPPMYPSSQSRYLMLYSLTASTDQDVPSAWTWEIGDCFVKDYLPGNLAYTPGVIPFSNIYSEAGTSTFDGWHGMPYPGYQYPFIYVEDKSGYPERLNNMINFMYDSQQEYANRYGITGPGMSAYIWNRWDNYKYVHPEHGDKVDGFTMYHWGTDNAWSGYQARAYMGAARCWYELMIQNRPIPPKLITYVDNWSKYLFNFMTSAIKSDGRPISPTDWSVVGNTNAGGIAKPLPDDFTPHMCGLFLAGACFSALAGTNYEMIEALVEMLAGEMGWKDYSRPTNSHYQNTGVAGHSMNGGFVPPWGMDTSDATGHFTDERNNSLSYGFHSGEVMRGLGMYLIYKQLMGNKNVDMYRLVNGGNP